MTTSLILHHGGAVTLPQARYWIGDPVAAGIDVEVPVSGLDGLYVRDGIVVGVFCRSLHDDAEYAIQDECEEIGIKAMTKSLKLDRPPVLRARGAGIAIVALAGVPGLGETLPVSEIHGFVLDFPCELQIERCGADLADIEVMVTGSKLLRLDLYSLRPRKDVPAPVATGVVAPVTGAYVAVEVFPVGQSSKEMAEGFSIALETLLGKEVAGRLISDGGLPIGVTDDAAARRLVADLQEIGRKHGHHTCLQAHVSTRR